MRNKNCGHKYATHEHGTNACYSLDKCRCQPCRNARKAYDRQRSKWVGEFPILPKPRVDAAPARAHVHQLMEQGMGPKRIAQVSGVPHGAVSKLIYGNYKSGAPPSKTLNRATADKLNKVELDLADGARVDAAEAWQIVEELVARGWAKAEIGRRLSGPAARSLQLGAELVTAGHLRTLRTLLLAPVPQRVHNVTGKPFTPKGRAPRFVAPSTEGVPVSRDTLREWDRIRLWQTVKESIDRRPNPLLVAMRSAA